MRLKLIGFIAVLTGFSFTVYKSIKKDFGAPLVKGEITDEHLPEISGLVRSTRNEGFLWGHNDSGHLPEIYLIDSAGHLAKIFILKDAANLDWEDIAIGSGEDGVPYLYVGDIGDNFGFMPFRTIYRFKEPALNDDPEIIQFEQMIYKYEDGSRDAETLMVTPGKEEVVVISKREKAVHVYTSAFRPFVHDNDTVHLKKLNELKLTQLVGGDISPDGQGILLKNYKQVFYWDLSGKGLNAIFEEAPQIIASYIIEPQGEAICWDATGKGFYTLSEFSNKGNSVLYYYPSIEE